jgi:hypothetical protein
VKRSLSIGVVVALALFAANARADGAYGRLTSDVGIELGVGSALASGGPSLVAEAAALYLATAGIYARYIDALGSSGPVTTRSIATGVWMRPLFLARFASNKEHGPARLDLLVDSIGLGLGAFWIAPRGSGLDQDPGLELALGVDLPVLESATGPFIGLRGALRLGSKDLMGRSDGLLESGAFVALTVAWHHLIGPVVIDAGDALER